MSGLIPNVSVIIPTHNRPDKLPRAVESVLNQTYEDFELIVVSDGSTDNTEQVVTAFGDRRIHFLKHDAARGASAARNTGIRAACGKYLAFLDDDDEWLPNKLETQLQIIRNSNEKLGLVYAWMDYFEDGRFIQRYAPKLRGDIFQEMLDKQAIGNSSTLMVKSSVIDKAGYFNENLPRGNDGDFIRRIAKHFEVDYVPQVLVRVYVGHNDRISVDSVENLKKAVVALENRLEVFKDDYVKYPAQQAAVLRKLAELCMKVGQFKKSLKYFGKTLHCNITLSEKIKILYKDVVRFVLYKLQNAFSPWRGNMHNYSSSNTSQLINCPTEDETISPAGKTKVQQCPVYERSDASQQSQYAFPYHYIPSLDNGHFSQHLYWSWGLHYLATIQLVLDILAEESFDTLVDVGCGDGRLLREVVEHFPDKRLLGVDYSSRAIDIARAMNPDLDFQYFDICKDKRLHQPFDVVTLVEVLEHIPIDSVDNSVRTLADFQKSGGRLILTVPHKNKSVPAKHYQHFDSESLKKVLQPVYEIERITFIDKTTHFLGRAMSILLANRFFILSNRFLLDMLYRIYSNRLFFCTEPLCNRICLVARKK